MSDDQLSIEQFQLTVKFEDGRYQVSWPVALVEWRGNAEALPTNFGLALGRLKSLLCRLNERPDLLEKHQAILEDQEKKGTIEKVPQQEEASLVH